MIRNGYILFLSAWLLWPGFVMAEEPSKDAKKTAISKSDSHKNDDDEPIPEYNTVVLQGLNKVTGRTSKIEGPLGTVQRFGTLEIIAHRCWKSSPEERPENASLLEIRELRPGESPQRIFLGWMFSSSPGLSGLENAVYDINLLSCEVRADPEKKEDSSKNKYN